MLVSWSEADGKIVWKGSRTYMRCFSMTDSKRTVTSGTEFAEVEVGKTATFWARNAQIAFIQKALQCSGKPLVGLKIIKSQTS